MHRWWSGVVLVLVLLNHALAIDAGRERNFQLLDAAREGHLGRVQALLQSGATVNVRNRFGNTPLLYAARGGHEV